MCEIEIGINIGVFQAKGRCKARKEDVKQVGKDICGAIVDTEKDLEDLLAEGIFKCFYE
jgi:hypothetical protein